MYDNLSIEEVVDELKSVRDLQKDLKAKEDALKERILKDGRDIIKGTKHTMTISVRAKETFNEEAFINTFRNDPNFSDELKGMVLAEKIIINESELTKAVQENIIPLDYVKPFNEVKETKTILVK